MNERSQVLALKYRPRRFEDLIGQETIAQTLSLALDSKRLSHAYLFSGLRGSGKTSTARIFAKALMCENGPTSHPCEQCEHCVTANEGRHMDIIEMDAASSRKIDDIRDLIEHTKYQPASAKFKIFIIDEVHMLTKEAFNALLKTLEEPPPFVKFILATTDPLKLPATILSRTQHFRFKKISNQDVSAHLRHILNLENITYEPEALQILARSGSGSLRDTLTLLDQAIIYSKHHVDVSTVTEMLGLIDPQFFESLFGVIFSKDRALLVNTLRELEAYEAEMVVDELTSWLKERLYDHDDSRFSPLLLERFFRILSEAKSLFAINAEGSFVLGLIFFKMIEALKVKEIDQMIESLEAQVARPDSVAYASAPAATAAPAVPTATAAPAAVNEEAPETPAAAEPEPVVAPAPDPALAKFEALCARIEDRSADLGKCFREQITFIAYGDDTLTWESCADDDCRAKLKHGFPVIKQLVREVFGFETKIKHNPCSQPAEEAVPKPEPVSGPVNVAGTVPTPESAPMPESAYGSGESVSPVEEMEERPAYMESYSAAEEAPQSASMTEEVETGSGSCVTGNCEPDLSTREIDGNAILDEPMIQKATELFEATKITIQNKV
ncbi:DNA polymerase III subunit gamma/tau [Sulfurimonas sp. HSL-3221]|uniref:DNA polymerase III subunit gamma/tau n=1 Tax=Thiomicrolovo sulfuroxydans TaxID=2894755 RepID=UPI001E3E63B1|nr:DNA polymerase III subunit gamma/tau [Sulfurimonas sp. HSL-3221]UFS63074.1 DNA polymerase III subunit gamma/tau [Sulfurimonas sp. HSL-3221]